MRPGRFREIFLFYYLQKDNQKINIMRELQEQFIGKGEVKGFIFTQIKKSEYAYVYEVDNGTRKYYEVFFRKENKQFYCVSYPSSKAFGLWAWSANENTYLDKFEELNLRRINALNDSNEQ